jgi:hypothetical protein
MNCQSVKEKTGRFKFLSCGLIASKGQFMPVSKACRAMLAKRRKSQKQ